MVFSHQSGHCSRKGKVCFVRPADLHPPMMLRDGRMAGLVKLHRGDRQGTERQVRAGYAKEHCFCRVPRHLGYREHPKNVCPVLRLVLSIIFDPQRGHLARWVCFRAAFSLTCLTCARRVSLFASKALLRSFLAKSRTSPSVNWMVFREMMCKRSQNSTVSLA